MAPNEAKPATSTKSTGIDRFLRRFACLNVWLLLLWEALQFGTPWNPWWLVVLTKFHVFGFLPVPLWLGYALCRRKRNLRLFRALVGLFCVPFLLWVLMYGRLWIPRSTAVPPPATLSVLTYNVLNAQNNLDRAIAVVLRLDPDLLCLQEVTERHAEELVARLSARYPHRRVGSPSPGGTTALFSKLPWIESGELTLPHGRPAVWATVESPTKRITVVSAHLMHYWRGEIHGLGMVPDYVADRTRWQEEQIGALIQRFGQEESPLILGMDGNLVPHSRSWQMLSRPFTDAAFVAGWRPFMPRPSDVASDLRPLKLDYLWVRNVEVAVVETGGDQGGSDHSPVIGRFHFPEEHR
jgi:endonuclease/exonuclease/phosphatase (EEP) superfamily protein YafD